MIATDHLNTQTENNVTDDEYEEQQEEILFYREKTTDYLYEVKLFQDFALIRLIMPDTDTPAGRLDLVSFAEQYEPFCGNVGELKGILYGALPSYFQVRKTNDYDRD